MKHASLLLATVLLFTAPASAQSILLRSETFHPNANIDELDLTDLSGDEVFNGRFYRLVQFDHIPDVNDRRELSYEGIELLEYIPHQAYIVSLADGVQASTLKANGIKWVSELDKRTKMHHWFFTAPYPEYAYAAGGVKVLVRLHRDVEYSQARAFFMRSGMELTVEFPHAGLMELIASEEVLNDIAELPFVAYMDMASEPGEPESLEGQVFHRSNGINTAYYGGLKYDGTGVSIAINDDGAVGPHIDYTGRVDQSDPSLSFYGGTHGDMTAGIAGAAGNLDPTVQGMAPGAFLWIRQYSSSLPNTVSLHTTNGVMAFSSSYSNGCNAGYTSLTQLVDQETYTYPTMIQSFSAGNSNNSNCGYGAGNQWGNVTGGHKIAKNAIAAANLYEDGSLVGSSSRGPASDGRIKPDIASHGQGQMSTDPNNAYSPGGGTSAACPGVTGVFAQLVHAYRDMNGGADAESGLLKACMLNSARDRGNVGPDYKFGWGRINAWRAYEILEQGQYFDGVVDQGASVTHTINIPAGLDEARVMVYWMDPAASTSAAKALVNDIDMTLTDPASTVLFPWVLDPTPDPALLDLPATNGVDTLNNMEQVAITNPAGGAYTLTVNGTEVPMGPQKYYVVYSFFDGVRLTHPIGGEGFDPGTTEMIVWDAIGNTGTFDLEYTLDGGANWLPIATVAADLRQYTWTVPNSPSGDVLVRVTRGGESDMSDAELSIMDAPTNLNVTAVCPTYMRVTWDAVSSATEYIVHLLGAQYMDSVDVTTATTYDIPISDPTLEQWFAVTALGANGMRSRRSLAEQFVGGGPTNCPVDHDVSVAAINSPGGTFISCGSLDVDVTIDLANPGLTDESNIPVSYRFNGGAIVSETYVPTLPGNSSVSYTFSTQVTLSSTGPNLLEVWTSLATDLATYNDTNTIDVNVIGGAGATMPIIEDFESEALCATSTDCGGTSCPLSGAWTNLTNGDGDDVDWRVDEGGTTSTNTGPSVDATTGSTTGNYIYLETSGTCNGQTAELISPCIDLTGAIAPQLSYSYHMYGGDMGSLHVDIYDGTTWINDFIPAVSGNQGDVWVPATVDLTSFVGNVIVIRMRGVTGTGFTSDMALDDLIVSEPPACPQPTAMSVTPTGVGQADVSWSCVGCTGSYLIEYGPVGFTPGIDGLPGVGGTVVSASSSPATLTGLPGCSTFDFYVRQFCGVDGYSFNSLVATASIAGLVAAPYSQDFDGWAPENAGVSCGGVDNMSDCWSNEVGNANNWTARSVPTGSTGTGPSSDNTGGGNYVYLETSSPCYPSVAGSLNSPAMDISALSAPQLSFYYHMNGADMGTLEVYISDDGGTSFTPAPVWSLSGDQGDIWHEGIVDLSGYIGETDVMFRWVGTSGSNFTSDFALDDISVDEAPTCPRPSLVSVSNVATTTADVSWNCALCVGTTVIEYGPAGFALGSGTQMSGVSSPLNLTGLASGSDFDVYLWEDCGGGDRSDTTGVVSFTTAPACGDNMYDNGGPANPYANNSNDLFTLCPDAPGERVRLDFTTFNVETSWDALYVFDGPSTASPMIASANPAPQANNVHGPGGWWGTTAPGPFISSHPSGCLTVAFTSDGSVQNPGWESTIICEPQMVTLDLKMMLEGPYDEVAGLMHDSLRAQGVLPDTEPFTALGFSDVIDCLCPPVAPSVFAVTGNDAIVDWVLVELRDATDATLVRGATPALLQRDGDVVDLDGVSSVVIETAYDNYHVSVRHRNHLGAMMSSAQSLGLLPTTVDFMDGAAAAWGTDAMKLMGSINTLWMGNAIADDILKYTGSGNDRDAMLTAIGGSVPTATVSGYLQEDANMDGVVKYIGTDNDRDPILVNVGGSVPTATRSEQLP